MKKVKNYNGTAKVGTNKNTKLNDFVNHEVSLTATGYTIDSIHTEAKLNYVSNFIFREETEDAIIETHHTGYMYEGGKLFIID